MMSGKRAAQEAHRIGHSRSADAIYADSAALLGLWHVAFYGERSTAQDRRKLRDAWRESQAIAAINGYSRPLFDRAPIATDDAAIRARIAGGAE